MSKKTADWPFEEALKRLEELVRRLEQGNVPLEQSLTEYAEAVELLRICQGKLDSAQSRIEVLSGFNADGDRSCDRSPVVVKIRRWKRERMPAVRGVRPVAAMELRAPLIDVRTWTKQGNSFRIRPSRAWPNSW